MKKDNEIHQYFIYCEGVGGLRSGRTQDNIKYTLFLPFFLSFFFIALRLQTEILEHKNIKNIKQTYSVISFGYCWN